MARARCGMEKTVRVERVLISSNALDFDSGVITHRTLLSALQLEKGIEAGIEDGNLDCLTSSDGGCLHISPLDLWNHNEQTLLSDTDLIATVNSDNEVTVKGLQVKSSMVLAGRESGDTHGSSTDFATYLALTYFFNEDDCNGSTGHNAWVKVLQQVSEGSDLSMNPQEPLFSTLEVCSPTSLLVDYVSSPSYLVHCGSEETSACFVDHCDFVPVVHYILCIFLRFHETHGHGTFTYRPLLYRAG